MFDVSPQVETWLSQLGVKRSYNEQAQVVIDLLEDAKTRCDTLISWLEQLQGVTK